MLIILLNNNGCQVEPVETGDIRKNFFIDEPAFDKLRLTAQIHYQISSIKNPPTLSGDSIKTHKGIICSPQIPCG